MELNKLKSGIISFGHRLANHIPLMKLEKTKEIRPRKYKTKKDRPDTVEITHSKWVPAIKEVLGVPVCEQYKYLGTILTPKLVSDPQMKSIKRKSEHLLV